MGTFIRLRMAIQDRLWAAEEALAKNRGWSAQRSARGWSIRIRDPRWDRRQICRSCTGDGRKVITGRISGACAGTGVVTLGPAAVEEAR